MYSQVQFNCLSLLPLLFRNALVIARNRVYCLEHNVLSSVKRTRFSDLIAVNRERRYFAKTRSSRKLNLQLGGSMLSNA